MGAYWSDGGNQEGQHGYSRVTTSGKVEDEVRKVMGAGGRSCRFFAGLLRTLVLSKGNGDP